MSASVGGSRVAADLGWIPNDRFVGLSGKRVAPGLYLAAGISGAGYHNMGIKGAENIIAINIDKGAEIFKLAHMAVAGDFQAVVPILTEKIRKYLSDRQES
jgi:electron transfer flavoprotein alpha subunit